MVNTLVHVTDRHGHTVKNIRKKEKLSHNVLREFAIGICAMVNALLARFINMVRVRGEERDQENNI